MNYSLAQIMLVSSDSDWENVIWVQMLVLVILAVLVGIGSLVRAEADKFKDRVGHYPSRARRRDGQLRRQIKSLKELKDRCLGIVLKTARPGSVDATRAAGSGRPKSEPGRERDLAGGMEMLELDFLLSVVENTGIDDKNGVMMRKLSFNELVRRKQLEAADSKALKVYAINKDGLYGKDVQCEAIKELAERTGLRS